MSALSHKSIGRSTRQMQRAPHKAIYIWYENDLTFVRYLAAKHNRDDLNILPWWVMEEGFKLLRNMDITAIVIDHLCPAAPQAEPFLRAMNEEGVAILRHDTMKD